MGGWWELGGDWDFGPLSYREIFRPQASQCLLAGAPR
ncbi:uncharacterized protein PODANS_4_7110 [Podospora anserina S mat+]|uniref:Podospora anserina S mat+ genomic DNA chromosome 4, supercontig 4 n=1 Tax=Podospora anserina (strain S / ATCC MYA-4624 / DSM 980 / FGSC 10383) TaxID=515849 RepID=B2ARL1_PODAN|nr:uncharacterized protein PODANS_4_7110 [Podospora anserina S mat+]CAP66789.1 unnamed protein product [Podospora anserina S mat+]CDP28527.1 Putative protein of unknown function [Podospora anserina S mat+]